MATCWKKRAGNTYSFIGSFRKKACEKVATDKKVKEIFEDLSYLETLFIIVLNQKMTPKIISTENHLESLGHITHNGLGPK